MAKKKFSRPKPKPTMAPTMTFPSLHDDILNVLSDEDIMPTPWFNTSGGDREAMEIYSTNIMGKFRCHNQACPKAGWASKRVAIVIRRYTRNGYNATVFNQRCKSCERLGDLTIDENSYVERVAYRLKKWAGIPVAAVYTGLKKGPEHEKELCEGCKRGYCERSGYGWA
ncbi:zinc-binding domain-containing protein [Achaetomium macrosporum]|uniref:Zinc-binding domain-containing protein n=1 Tax=Achaetomium macrosporum TaxID=79813 RepID=A0AAN7C2Q1_9PEZI|nr:zinc-binding domain-containing protein [Achaetomium macrosporum]